ncbi:MAG: glycine cleavage system aminomethyltransferase GcvT [Candidatus Zixiibacteriota bacterium]|nr:MAG: glycine cleavage system aminomethyltransferase GcvT [candidate division Zixibacteria bacterium]
MIKKTPFHEIHRKLEAKIVEFAGYYMPLQYRSMIEEHKRVRKSVGLFDLSHMGEFQVRGEGAAPLVQNAITNDISRLEIGQVLYTCMCYPDGGIVDDLLVYNLGDEYMLVVNASNIEKDFAHLKSLIKSDDVDLINLSDETALLAIQGPDAQKALAKMTDCDLESIPFYWSATAKVAGVEMIFSRTGYTGEDGFELYFPPEYAGKVWDAAAEAAREFDGEPIGLGARDTLRLEMKYALYGNDIDQTTNPIEAGLGWTVKLDKADFVGKEAIARVKAEGPKRRLVAFELKEKGIPRQHYPIICDGKKAGEVTSGMFSPMLEKGVGAGYVDKPYDNVGNEIGIDIRGKIVPAEIVKPPFYKQGTRR